MEINTVKIAVIGLGYVGLPIALEFSKNFEVIGFDIKPERIQLMNNKIDPSNELDSQAFENCNIKFSFNIEDLRTANFYIVAVPTPIDIYRLPDLNPLLKATETIGKVLKKGDYVVFESTVYPCCTEDECVPVLEKISGLKYMDDFKVGFSPERINPGDKEHTLTKIKKVVSGCDQQACNFIAEIYGTIIKAGIYKASSIKVAEAAKIIENTQRDINIAFMNELSLIFSKMNINTYDVLEAAATKWNFLKFSPGLVGGHCIGVDPYYLTYKAQQLGHHARIIDAGRAINDEMGTYIAQEIIKKIINSGKNIKNAKVLVLGITFKENVSDIRNSKVIDIIEELQSFMLDVHVVDAFASAKEVYDEYHLRLKDSIDTNYTAVVLAVAHQPYLSFDEEYFKSILNSDGIFVDIKGVYKNKIKELNYWSL